MRRGPPVDWNRIASRHCSQGYQRQCPWCGKLYQELLLLEGGVTSCRRCRRDGTAARNSNGAAGHGKKWQTKQQSVSSDQCAA